MILDKIVLDTKRRVQQQKTLLPLAELTNAISTTQHNRHLETALQKSGIQFICEVKKASPSKGVISKDFDPCAIAKSYELAGAAAISVLTETTFFQGHSQDLKHIREITSLPLLRKDFIIDPYQVFEAKAIGADAILLICAILTLEELTLLYQTAKDLNLSVLVETHNKAEVAMALAVGAKIIGVNNRNLADFTTDVSCSIRMRPHVPSDVVFVAESGIKTRADIRLLEEHQVDAVLIGETVMKSQNTTETLAMLRGTDL